MDVDQAKANHLRNIAAKTGKSLDEMCRIIAASGLTKHTEVIAMLKADLRIGHGDANAVALYAKNASIGTSSATADPLEAIYTGPKAALRPVHDQILAAVAGFGEFETAPKKGYVSLRRRKQFAMVGPATNSQVEIGLNMKGIPAISRLVAMPEGGMCQYKVRLSGPGEVDDELVGWLKTAYESAG